MQRALLAFRIFALLLCTQLTAQSVVGDWRGAIAVPGAPLAIVVHLTATAGALAGTIDIPAQQAVALPLTDVAIDGAEVRFAIADVPGAPKFRGTLAADGASIAGSFTQGGQKMKFTLQRAAAAAVQERAVFDGMQAWLDETRAMFAVPGCAVAVVGLLGSHCSSPVGVGGEGLPRPVTR
jgi:hypothetical protein